MSIGRMNRIEDLDGNPLWDKDNGILGNVTTSTGTQPASAAIDSRLATIMTDTGNSVSASVTLLAGDVRTSHGVTYVPDDVEVIVEEGALWIA